MRWQRIVAVMALLWCMTVFGGDYTTLMAEAVQSITSISADPLLVQDSTPTTVTVTVTIAQDPGLIRNSVMLQQFDEQGKVIGSQPLYNDGIHGDVKAGDNIFTTQLVLNEKAPKILVFRASAAYLKQVRRVSSPTLAILVKLVSQDPQTILNTTAQALRTGDLSTAYRNLGGDLQHRQVFNGIDPAMLQSFADFLDALQLVESSGDIRVYTGSVVINNVVRQLQVVMTMDQLGVWRIVSW